ncbi:DUF1853 family protein [Pseudomonas aeruginosa]|uniref:DUF1853 family protein n=1 Tax=Pseudomonas aeruginosa TaxID=287 RepID=UPI00006D85EE|nr:DUF1853 family protein [Pseudomonas aeruginosa]EAZ53502.1 hypothetical protein PACG_02018 [Pseudomonas aeruginosa C3719]MBG5169106.1 DUF1853 family protein [Pseudomonas aeruginosa]MBH4059521.1 DUF1853 family protein [Pseudomonas aeruginosa]MBI8530031.1 DUF1853 family protein [Pseudomonas aeruginosa]MBI8636475.1 DUF1853 family protein [Pseudomonas aeruginosa]
MTLLTELLDELRHPAVRDLAWTLLAPPLLRRTPEPQRHPLAASRWRQEPERLAAWLREQERQPQHLAAWLAQWPRQRLGLYYEHLWQFALEQAPDVRLIAANLPVRDGGHTLGELDLLLRDDDGIHHLELAIKLYLGPQSGPGDWLGPGGQDRLSRKLEHLCRHQLPLAATREGRQVLAAHGAESAVSALWLSGYLFHPWPGPGSLPADIEPRHLRGRWLRQRDWPAYLASLAGPQAGQHWLHLSREHWLAPAMRRQNPLDPPRDGACWNIAFADEARPQMLVRVVPRDGYWVEAERLFLASDDWPPGLSLWGSARQAADA